NRVVDDIREAGRGSGDVGKEWQSRRARSVTELSLHSTAVNVIGLDKTGCRRRKRHQNIIELVGRFCSAIGTIGRRLRGVDARGFMQVLVFVAGFGGNRSHVSRNGTRVSANGTGFGGDGARVSANGAGFGGDGARVGADGAGLSGNGAH